MVFRNLDGNVSMASRNGIGLFAGVFATLLVAATAYVMTGRYNVAADAPHTGPVSATLETVRIRSVQRQARDVVVPPDLDNPKRIAAGAADYAEMCSQCHLAPGMKPTEISRGIYPDAPEFSRGDRLSPAEQFWTVKHGIKFTSMPAWGPTHSDAALWNVVAFLRKLPTLSAAQYEAMTGMAAAGHENKMKTVPQHDSRPHRH
jgi:mono/diheme cytochrome c family protein